MGAKVMGARAVATAALTRRGWATEDTALSVNGEFTLGEMALSEIEMLEAHLQSRLGRRVRDFRLQFSDNGLVLHGHAPTYYAKQLAQQAVMEVTDRPIAANHIVVS